MRMVDDVVCVLSPGQPGVGAVGAEGTAPCAAPGPQAGPGMARAPERRERVDPGGTSRVTLRTQAALSSVTPADIDAALAAGSGLPPGAFPGLPGTPLGRALVKGGVRGGSWRRFPTRAPGVQRKKLLWFFENQRPAFWGKYTAQPDRGAGERLSGRAPIAQAGSMFNYEVRWGGGWVCGGGGGSGGGACVAMHVCVPATSVFATLRPSHSPPSSTQHTPSTLATCAARSRFPSPPPLLPLALPATGGQR